MQYRLPILWSFRGTKRAIFRLAVCDGVVADLKVRWLKWKSEPLSIKQMYTFFTFRVFLIMTVYILNFKKSGWIFCCFEFKPIFAVFSNSKCYNLWQKWKIKNMYHSFVEGGSLFHLILWILKSLEIMSHIPHAN